MSVTTGDVITAASLLLSIGSLITVVTLSVMLRRSLKPKSGQQDTIDTSAVVAEFTERMRALEQKMIDQKVRLEILDLRMGKEARLGSNVSRQFADARELSKPIDKVTASFADTVPEPLIGGPAVGRVAANTVVKSAASAGEMQEAILKIVLADGGNVSARQIQRRIGRSREHTARIMNALFRQGLVTRSDSTPFKYSLTETGRLRAVK